jgi:hypothetical protein
MISRPLRGVRNGLGSLHTRAHTIYSPTTSHLDEFLSDHPSSDPSLYVLSTSLPSDFLSPLLSLLQKHLPSSIGSFSLSPPNHEPSLSILSFSGAKSRIFRSSLTGRQPVEVGRWQRPRGENVGDTKGREEGGIGEKKAGLEYGGRVKVLVQVG